MKLKDNLWSMKTICIIYVLLSMLYLDLPGLYMDSVNPDYLSLHISSPEYVPSWSYPDNAVASAFFHEPYRYPVLNSLYGTGLPAYLFLFVSKVIGSSIGSIRVLHFLYCIGILCACFQLLKTAACNSKIAFWGTFFLAMDASMVFVFRTQYYLQLFPHLFFIPAVVILTRQIGEITEGREKRGKVFLASVLMGAGASSYFLFAGYYAFLFMMLCIICILTKRKARRIAFPSIAGFILGYLPFLYGHLSILLQSGVQGYIGALKGLDVYGIQEGQASIPARVSHFFKIMLQLPGGDTIINGMAGVPVDRWWSRFVAGLFFCFFLASIILIRKEFRRKKCGMFQSKEVMALVMLDLTVAAHFLMAVLAGTSLGYQHYIMLLPVMYMVMALTGFCFFRLVKNSGWKARLSARQKELLAAAVAAPVICLSLGRVAKGYQAIIDTGGAGYYSRTINDIGCYLRNAATEDDVILCPQWGYWMGLAVITGGKTEIWNNTQKEEIILKINSSPKAGKFYYIHDNNTDPFLLDEIVEETGLTVETVVPFQDYGDILQAKAIMLTKVD